MPSNTTTKLSAEGFLGLVKQSGLVDHDTLKKAVKEVREADPNISDPRAAAEQLVARNVLTRWQADKLLQGRHKGFFLGKYRLLSHLGSGGMSAVYLAEHVLMRRRVAIKVLPQSRVEDSSYLQRFHREAQAVAALDHRNIVRAYDVDQEGKNHFLVMEYVPGQSLHELAVRKGRLDFVEAVEFARQAAEGLQHAHRMGMVHRDIKPGNLLLDERGTIKLLDLGLARFFGDEEHSLTLQHDEKVLGTADFLSPEQALDSHNVDIRSDIYSLGCTLYFLLTGRPPFPDGTLAQRLLAHQTKTPTPIQSLRPETPSSLVAVLDRMMAKKPDDRYQTAKEASTALLQWLMENGGVHWSKMNPVVAGSSSLISGASAPVAGPGSSSVLSGDAPSPARTTIGGATDISRRDQVQFPDLTQETDPAGAAASSTGAPESVGAAPELAAFLAGLGGADGGAGADPLRRGGAPPPPLVAPPNGAGGSVMTAPDLAGSAATMAMPPELGLANGAEVADEPAFAVPAQKPASGPSAFSANPQAAETPNRAPAALGTGRLSPKGKPAATTRPAGDGPPPQARQPSGVASAARASPAGSLLRSPLFLGGAGVVVTALLVVSYFAFRPGQPAATQSGAGQAQQPDREPDEGEGKTATVKPAQRRRELRVGPDAPFQTIGEALAEARNNPSESRRSFIVIKVAGGRTYPERIVLDETYPRGIQIVAQPGAVPVLAPTGAEPVVSIQGGQGQVEDFALSGFQIDAGGKPVAVQIADWVPGLRLHRLELTGFSEVGVLLNGVQTFGADDERIVLEQVTFKNPLAEAAGVVLRHKQEDPVHVRLAKCRFLGPMAAGVRIESGAIDIEVFESIFSRLRSGVRLEGTERRWRDIALAHNTFFENERAVVFTHMPGSESFGFGFHNNLFAGTRDVDALVEAGYDDKKFFGMYRSAGGASHNWTTRPRRDPPLPGELVYLFETRTSRFGATDAAFLSTDPASPDFLAPAPGSPQSRAGTMLDKRRFGPQVGAIRPR